MELWRTRYPPITDLAKSKEVHETSITAGFLLGYWPMQSNRIQINCWWLLATHYTSAADFSFTATAFA
jgi:hypothetical protein